MVTLIYQANVGKWKREMCQKCTQVILAVTGLYCKIKSKWLNPQILGKMRLRLKFGCTHSLEIVAGEWLGFNFE